jgi:hypothetical protein
MLSAYYVSPSGDDAGPGTLERPWRTIERVNAYHAGPGDRILFEGGRRFDGGLYFGPTEGGTATDPLVVGSYGGGRATIVPPAGTDGLLAYNSGGIDVADLNFAAAAPGNAGNGVDFYSDAYDDGRNVRVRVERVEASGFGGSGIVIGGAAGAGGYRDVRIADAVVHGNARAGIATYGADRYTLEDVYVGHCRAYDNAGIAGAAGHTGDGIVLGSVDRGTVERSVAYGNGTLGDGAVGIWAYDSNAVTIQFNESYANRTSGARDGGGFALDGGTTRSVLQYNYSHGNDGSGYGLFEYAGAPAWSGNTVRYNVSENDGRKNGYAGIHAWDGNGGGGLRDAEVYHNTIYVAPATSGRPRGIYVQSATTDLRFRNNVVHVAGGVPAIDVAGGQVGLLFQGNAYWSAGAPLALLWAGTAYSSLDDWRAATGEERVGSTDTGLVADPLFESPGGGGTIGDADLLGTLAAYRPRPNSPLLDAGLILSARFGIDPGGRDFAGVSLPQAGGHDVGAAERATPPGDADRNGAVNFDDLLILAKNYNGTGRTWSQGDFNGDGVVNFDDLLVLAKNYNRSVTPAGAEAASATPLDVGTLAAALGVPAPTAPTPTPKLKPSPKSPPKRATPRTQVVPPPKASKRTSPVAKAPAPIFSSKPVGTPKKSDLLA